MNVVCYERVCSDHVCYESGLFRVVFYEQVYFEREPFKMFDEFCQLLPMLVGNVIKPGNMSGCFISTGVIQKYQLVQPFGNYYEK